MIKWLALGMVLIALGCSSKQGDHDMNGHGQHHGHHREGQTQRHSTQAGSKLIVATDPTGPVADRPVTLQLTIHATDGTMVKDFEVMHQEKVHLVIVREGLDQFAHIHPPADANGNLTISHTFRGGGKYHLFADYMPVGGRHATAIGSLSIGGDAPPAPALTPDAPGEVAGDGLRATVTAASLKAGTTARVFFALRDEGGGPAQLEPYMGELGHLMFVGTSSMRYVHVHPVSGDAARGTVEFEAQFPAPGRYKGWGQFKRDGRVRVLPLTVEVE